MSALEQEPPNKPNFKLILYLFAGALVVIFIFAYMVLHWSGRDLLPGHHAKEPHSQLVLPAGDLQTPAAALRPIAS